MKQDKHACQKELCPISDRKRGSLTGLILWLPALETKQQKKKRMRGEVLNATVCEFDNKLTRLDKQVIKSSNTTTTNGILKNLAISAGPGRLKILPKQLQSPAQTISARCPVLGLTDWRRNTLKKQKTNIN